MELIIGKVEDVRYASRGCAQVKISGDNRLVEVYSYEAIVVKRGDDIAVAGFQDYTGKFKSLAYRNIKQSVLGHVRYDEAGGKMFMILGVLFFWAIFPLFFHYRVGRNQVKYAQQVKRAIKLVIRA